MMMLASASQDTSRVDELTRLWNEETIEEIRFLYHAEARKSHRSSAVVIARVDGDESLRSSAGPESADEVIRQVAKRALASARSIDAVGRSGPDEFTVLLAPGTDRAGCLAIAQQIRQRVAETPITLASGEHSVTLSVGMGYCQNPTDNYGSVQHRAAQHAIESARSSGGNCVEYEFVEGDDASGKIAA
ncbi:MAG: GGDEF domain-containing protein [Phycisphaera sp.]|nr:MAG: GGDEF domain-containing protein [Phycisphaera sp.]